MFGPVPELSPRGADIVFREEPSAHWRLGKIRFGIPSPLFPPRKPEPAPNVWHGETPDLKPGVLLMCAQHFCGQSCN